VIGEDDIEAVAKAMRSGWLNEHKLTRRFEKRFAKAVGRKYAIACTNGTTALFMALKVTGVKRGQSVVIPAFTAIGTANAVRLTGATPKLMDFGSGEDVKGDAMVSVHINGVETHYDGDSNYVVEDCCQALGSPIRSMSHVAVYSLATSKIITTGQGGMVVTDSGSTHDKLMAMKDQGRPIKTDWYPLEGYNFKFNEMQAALGLSQLKKLKKRVKHMKHIHKLYAENLSNVQYDSSWLPWRIEMVTDKRVIKWDLKKKGIEVGWLPQPLNLQPGFDASPMPNASRYVYNRVYLPSSCNLTDEQALMICDEIQEALND
jgi:perosamine synthetase